MASSIHLWMATYSRANKMSKVDLRIVMKKTQSRITTTPRGPTHSAPMSGTGCHQTHRSIHHIEALCSRSASAVH